MNFTKLRYFTEVAKCKSFSEAAKKLYTAQPNVSKQIAQMEQELGYPLFIRSKRVVTLTPAGQFLYDSLGDLPDRLDAVFGQALNIAHRGSGKLSIGILEGQEMQGVVRQRFDRVGQVYPQLTLELESNSFRNLRTGLQSGYYDIIISMDFDLQSVPGVQMVPFFSQPPAIAINNENPMAQKKELTLRELSGEDFVVISEQESPAGYLLFVEQCRSAGFMPRVVYKPNSLESLLLCVELGKGVALLDQNTRLARNSNVRTIPVEGEPMCFSAACLGVAQSMVVRNVMHILGGEDR